METIVKNFEEVNEIFFNKKQELDTPFTITLTKDEILDICNAITQLHTSYPLEFWANKEGDWYNDNKELIHLNNLHFLTLKLANFINEKDLFVKKFTTLNDNIHKEITYHYEKLKKQRILKKLEIEQRNKDKEQEKLLKHKTKLDKLKQAQLDKQSRLDLALELLKSAERQPIVKKLLKKTAKKLYNKHTKE